MPEGLINIVVIMLFIGTFRMLYPIEMGSDCGFCVGGLCCS